MVAAWDGDFRTVFDLAPVGLIVSSRRTIVDCNDEIAAIFRHPRNRLIGQSLQVLYPNLEQFERVGQRILMELDEAGRYADDRIMRRDPDNPRGELFWCHVTGQALDRNDPHSAGIWAFEDLSAFRSVGPPGAELTSREREVATLLIQGLTSKQMAFELGLSVRTVDVHRANLLRKYAVRRPAELIERLLHGVDPRDRHDS